MVARCHVNGPGPLNPGVDGAENDGGKVSREQARAEKPDISC
jgi:hypothetical protein